MKVVMLPEIELSTLLLMRILLMRVAVFSVVLVCKVIWGIKLCDKRFSRNLLTPSCFACLSRLRLFHLYSHQLEYNFCFHELFHIFIIKLKVLHRWVLVDSTQYVALYIGEYMTLINSDSNSFGQHI